MSLDPSNFRTLRLERRGPVLRIVLDHPESKLNAVDGLMHEELTRLFRELKSGQSWHDQSTRFR